MSCTIVASDAAHGYQITTTYIADPARDAVLMRVALRRARPATSCTCGSTRWRAGPAAAARRTPAATAPRWRRVDGQPGAGRVQHQHDDQRRQPRLRGPDLRGARVLERVLERQRRLCRHGHATVSRCSTPRTALTTVRLGARRPRGADRAPSGAQPSAPIELALGFGKTQSARPERRRRLGGADVRARAVDATSGSGQATTPACAGPRQRSARPPCTSTTRRSTSSRPARTRPSPARSPPASRPLGASRCPPATSPTASRPTSAPTARCSRATSTRPSPACWSPATSRPPGPPTCSCSTASSSPTGRCRATRWRNGKPAPDTGGLQLDETSYPILMDWQSGLAERLGAVHAST